METPTTWQQYEQVVLEHFRNEYPDATVTQNVHVRGRYSGVDRQLDVLIDGSVAGFRFRIAVDAKHRARPIDVTDVESFIGFCADVDAHKGVLIALRGFTPAAIARAHNDQSDIELDVLNFADLKRFQAFGAFPYAGGHGVAVSAPFGWVIDGTCREGMVATLYQRGHNLETAARAREWMYINFWSKGDGVASIDDLQSLQEQRLRQTLQECRFEYLDGPARGNDRTKIRIFRHGSYPAVEVTGYIEFSAFIVFFVMFTPEDLLSRNLRKLDHVLRTAVPLSVSRTEDSN